MKSINLTIESTGYKARQFTDDKGNKIDYFVICTPKGDIKASKQVIDALKNSNGTGDYFDNISFTLNKGIIKLVTTEEAQNYEQSNW